MTTKNDTALIIVHDGFTDSEFIYAYYRCLEEDIDVVVATITGKDAYGEYGCPAKADMSVDNASILWKGGWWRRDDRVFNSLFDILILPGGVKSIEKVRQNPNVIQAIKDHFCGRKIIASMCHGGQLLIESGLARHHRISGYYSIKTDIVNAGGTYIDGVTLDEDIVSAPHYKHNGKWMGAVISLWKQQKNSSLV